MPKLFKVGRYIIFFWSNEAGEPIHVHIAMAKPTSNATKIWITRSGGCIVAHNKSQIPQKDLNKLLEVIQDNFFYICSEWKGFFDVDDIRFYC